MAFSGREAKGSGAEKKNPGHLKGVLVGKLKGTPVDFRSRQGVCVLYIDKFRFVGSGELACNENQRLFARLKQHRKDKLADRWTRASWLGLRQVLKSRKLSTEVITTSFCPTELDHLVGGEYSFQSTIQGRVVGCSSDHGEDRAGRSEPIRVAQILK